MQSRRHSAMEAALNTGSGFVVSWLVWIAVAPLFGMPRDARQTTEITVLFTVVSLIRSYAWRRVFNYIHSKGLL